MSKKSNSAPISALRPFDDATKSFNVVIETPRGCRNKYKFVPERGVFTLHHVLPAGAVFPYDFGYIPGTIGDDGDPLDVLVLMDQPAFTGCVVPARLIGVIEAEQTEPDGKAIRNDRIVAVATQAHDYQDLKSLKDVNQNLMQEIEHFFVSYNEMRGRKFEILAQRGPKQAQRLISKGTAHSAS